MKSLKARLIIVTAVLVALLGLSVLAISVKNQNARRDAAVPDAVLPLAQIPVLTVSGEENQDVYLQSLDIDVEITGNIASTRYTMVVKNRRNSVLEGIVTFPLPNENVTVTYYALDINGKMREAVPVEKARGTQVFEAIKSRRVDPGLLEWVEGNTLRTRIYPIFSNDTRTVSIVCKEELARENDSLYYRLPMAYTDSLETFTLSAAVLQSGLKPRVLESEEGVRFKADGENCAASFARRNYRPSRALVFALPAAPADTPQVIMQSAHGNRYFLASVAPKMETRRKQWDSDLAIIWDVSLSGLQRGLKREMEMLDIIFTEKKDANVRLYFLNNKIVKNGEYKVTDGNWDKLKNVLKTAVFDGGTDFSQINLNNIAGNEILFFSDGISTLSDADFLNGVTADRPVHCVVSSANADYGVMKFIAGKTKGKFVNVNALSSEKLKDELLNETPLFLGAEHGKTVREVYPGTVTPVHGNFSVAGISDANDAELTLLFGFGDTVEKRIKVRLDAKNAANRGNTDKIWAQKKIAEPDLDYEKKRAELAALGKQFGIVTRNTSLIVLETVSDYIRYGIEPPATDSVLLATYRFSQGGDGSAKTRTGVRDIAGNNGGSPANNSADRSFFRQRGDDSPQERVARIMSEPVSADLAPDNNVRDQKQLKPSSGSSGSNQGGGDPRARVSRTDVLLGIVSGQISGKGYGVAEPMGTVRRPPPEVLDGSSPDFASADGIFGDSRSLDLRKRSGKLTVESRDLLNGGTLTGGRSRAGIRRVVMQNIAALRYAYKRRCRDVPGLGGTITVKFAIDEFGKVIFARVTESTMNDAELESTVETRVKSWVFERIDKPGDVTEVTFPFAFMDCSSSWPREETEQTRERIARAAERAGEVVPQSKYGVTVSGAVAAAGHLKKWWNSDFAASQGSKYKYPAPDESGGVPDINSAKGGFAKDKDYLKGLTGKIADDYQTYLNLRNDHANSPSYYFDMAHWFYTLGDRETALRVLTSIAELERENASHYRLLGYRFKEYGEYALEKFVCRKVVQWCPMEPQSYRDYALALADNGETQGALDSLCSLLKKPYSENILFRSRGMEEVIVTEINRLIAKNPGLNTSKIDKRLIINVPVDIRVVINWNTDNTDMDLHVEDPNGEECYYRYRQTDMGGRISADNGYGYGPEQFLLKRAVKGKYLVYVSYYGGRQFASTGPSTVMAEVYTKYAGKAEQRKVITLQMSRSGSSRRVVKVQAAEIGF